MDFREKLVQIGKIAKKNLKSTQKSIKARYDEISVEHKFSPGDEVPALLPIPGRPLKARYFGPYVVDKRVSDL